MNAADRIRVRHMLDAAAEAMEFAKGHTAEDLQSDRMLLLALVKEIEMIGEAAAQISEEFRASRPDVPWAMIRGMRNRLIPRIFRSEYWSGLEHRSFRTFRTWCERLKGCSLADTLASGAAHI